jgi:outer membrane protein OmpA-like peptidoglycan-associated protein
MKRAIIFSLIMLLNIFSADIQAMEEIQITGPESAAKVTFQSVKEDEVLISVLDAEDNPILGLQPQDFAIKRGSRNGKILTVEPLKTSKEVDLNVVLIVDNSFSMKERKAVQPLFDALESFYSVVRPIDDIHAIVFDDNETISVGGLNVHARVFKSSNVEELRSFFKESFESRLTNTTYLYDSMAAGLDIIRKMPAESHKILLVLTDGEDINSATMTSALMKSGEGIPEFSSYALDFTDKQSEDYFLKTFSEAYGGRIWKAHSSDELVPILKAFSTRVFHRYVATYRFFNPPQGTLALEPSTVTIEEVTTIDSSPLLNYVFFEEGESTISRPYVLLSNQAETRDFSEKNLRDPMEKYSHILNIIGKRLTDNPDAQITIVGSNSNQGKEKGNMALSRGRAETVQMYLQNIWGIDPARMEVKAQNLPAAPSTNSIAEGIAENRRVEIHSDHPAILDTIRSTYVQEVADTKAVSILPQIEAESGIDSWKVELKGEHESVIQTASGEGDMTSALTFNLVSAGLSKIASFKTITASVEVTDKEGETFRDRTAATSKVRFIRREEMRAQKKGDHVLEKYALILFDFDKAEIRERNRVIVDRIIARMKELPSARIKIVGHTDNIGKEEYNIRLSERRAQAVLSQLLASGIKATGNLGYGGVGPRDPLYDNSTPEGRALNRTVTITLEYEEKI